jgi:hypothetical protein
MKKIVLVFASILVSSIVTAQVVDFSGSWKLNSSKSKLGDQFSMAPKELIITQSTNELNVERHSSFQDQDFTTKDKFTLDGKECINAGWQDTQKKSTLTLSEDKKSIKCITKFAMGDGNEMIVTEVYKMDGSNLVIESSASSSFGEMAETMVYDKQ